MEFHDDFSVDIDPRWQQTEQGNGTLVRRAGMLHLNLNPTDEQTYSNAQLTEYDPEQRDFKFHAPLRMTVTAFSSLHPVEIKGTAGFGFWNHPFEPGRKGFKLPQALWFFFASPPNDMQLAKGVPGNGWKAATINATGLFFKVMMPLAPLAMLMMRVKALYRALWSIGQNAMGVSECLLDNELLTAQHTYTLEWQTDKAIFSVDGEVVQETENVPKNALGFIAWMDNQYAVVTPQGQIKFGLVEVDRPQALVLTELKIESL